ncbi:uncharacterized protein [Euwallacea similis]|uniref:uncharacterized protein n=1 Tax=Euwallacea similis TaxID=1736056 RepID=UPI00344F8A55
MKNLFVKDYEGDRIIFLCPIIKYLRFVGVVPNYNFEQEKVEHQWAFSITSLAIFMGIAYASFIVWKIQINGNTMADVKVIIHIGEISFIGYSIIQSWWSQKTWEAFFKSLQKFDKIMDKNPRKCWFIFNRHFILISLSFLLFAEYIVDYYISTNYISPEEYLIYLPVFIYFYQVTLNVFLAGSIALYFKHSLHNISLQLATSLYTTECKKSIIQCKKAYLELVRGGYLFNVLFGTRILIMILISLLQSLITFYSLYTNKSLRLQDMYMYGSTFYFIGLVLLSQYILTYCCDLVERKTEDLLETCYTLQQAFKSSSSEHKELELLVNKIMHKNLKFTAAHYFDLNRGTMFDLFWNITTYFIALVQLDNDHSKVI